MSEAVRHIKTVCKFTFIIFDPCFCIP
jgi:hypothetical protein